MYVHVFLLQFRHVEENVLHYLDKADHCFTNPHKLFSWRKKELIHSGF